MGCTQAKQKQSEKEEVRPYTIQNDVLGESLADFQKNQKCILQPDKNGVEGAQTCVAPSTHYAGMDFVDKVGSFYQGELYRVSIESSTEECNKAHLLSLLTERFGEPKSTETVRLPSGKLYESTPAVLPPGPPFKIWQSGVATIEFLESIGSLDSCVTSFSLDELSWKVSRLEEEEKRKKEEAKKKDM